MTGLLPISPGSYDPSFAYDDPGYDFSGLGPPPEPEPEAPLPLGYNDATKQVFINGDIFDVDDHQSAMESGEALKRPVQRMPETFRSIPPEDYAKYLSNIHDPSLSRLASKNFGIGIDNLQLLAGYGLQLAGMEDVGKGIVDQQLKDLHKTQPYQRAFTDLSIDKPGGIVDWFVANLAQQGPMLIESVLAAGVGAVAGQTVAPGPVGALGGLIAGLGGKVGLKNAALAAARKRALDPKSLTKGERNLLARLGGATLFTAANNYGIGASDVYGEQLEGGTADKGTALALGIPYAIAETIPELIGAGLLFKGAKGGIVKRFGKGAALGSVGEGTTEFVQEIITASQNPKLTDREKSLRYINAFAAGAGVGGTVTGLGLAARGRRGDTQEGPQEGAEDATGGALAVIPPTGGLEGGVDTTPAPVISDDYDTLVANRDQANVRVKELFAQYEEAKQVGDTATANVLSAELSTLLRTRRAIMDRIRELDAAREPLLIEQQPLTLDVAEEQRVQAEARDRAALAAAERGDVAAFEQPDLFALEQEQEARRLGPIDVEQPEANLLDPTSTVDPDQLDLPLTVASAQEIADTEIQEIENLLEQDVALRAESDLETIQGQLDTQQIQQTEDRRGEILGSILTNVTNKAPAGIVKKFARELRKAGITQTDPTESELRTIEAAANFAAAAAAPLEEVTPQATQTIEGQVFPRTAVPVVPKKGDRLRTPTQEAVAPTQEAVVPTVNKSDNVKQSTTEFAPTTAPQLVDRRGKKDLAATAKGKEQISGGKQEGRVTDTREREQIFDKIKYTAGLLITLLPQTVQDRYAGALNNIKVTRTHTKYAGAHHNGGIVLQGRYKYALPIEPNIVAHELGHASHSLLGEQLNGNPAVLTELQAVENLLYPDLRTTVTDAIDGGKKLSNNDIEFFNYLLSPEELIAEFNVFRLADPEQAAQIAPVLSQLLESVEQAPNLVVNRKTFPSGYGTIVVKANETFDGDYTKLHAGMAKAQKEALRKWHEFNESDLHMEKAKKEALKKGKPDAQTTAEPSADRADTQDAKPAKPRKDRREESGAAKLAKRTRSKRTTETGKGDATLRTRSKSKAKEEAPAADRLKETGTKKEKVKSTRKKLEEPVEREEQQPAPVDEKKLPLKYPTVGAAWDALRLTHWDYLRKWSQLTAGTGKPDGKSAEQDAARAAWEKAFKEYKVTREEGDLIKALGHVRTILPKSPAEKLRLAIEAYQDDTSRNPVRDKEAALIAIFNLVFPSDAKQDLLKVKPDGKQLLQSVFTKSGIIQSADDKALLIQQYAAWLEDSIGREPHNTIKITANGSVALARNNILLGFTEFALDSSNAGALEVLIQALKNKGATISTAGANYPEILADALADTDVLATVDKKVEPRNPTSVRISTLITKVETEMAISPHVTGLPSGVINADGSYNSFDYAIAVPLAEIADALKHGRPKPDMSYRHRGVALREWIHKGKLNLVEVSPGGRRVIAEPKGALPAETALLEEADSNPVEGRTSTWEGAPITKPISMGILRMERIKIMRKLNPKARPSVKIYTDVETLKAKDPKIFKEAMDSRSDKKPIPTNASGYAYATTDANGRIRYKILLFQKNIKNRQHAKFVVAHEAIGHLGLRTIMTDKNFNRLMDDLYIADPSIRAEADMRIERDGVSKREATEEALADAAGYIESRFLVRIWKAIKDALNKLGMRFDDDMTRYFIHLSKRYLRAGTVSDPSARGVYHNIQELQRRHVEGRASNTEHLAGIVFEQHAMNRSLTGGIRDYVENKLGSSATYRALIGKGLELIQTLDNIALKSPGLQKILQIFNLQHEHIRDLQTKYRDITEFSNRGRITSKMKNMMNDKYVELGLTTEERDQVNELLWKASLYKGQQLDVANEKGKPKYEEDILVKNPITGKEEVRPLATVSDTGVVSVDAGVKKRLKELGAVSKPQFKEGFSFVFSNEAGKKIKSDKKKLAVKFEITDRIWQAYQEQRKVVDEAALDVYTDKIYGMTQARKRHVKKIQEDNQLETSALPILDAIGDLYLGLVADKSGYEAYLSVYHTIRVMHEEHGTLKMQDFFNPDIESKDAATIAAIKATPGVDKVLSQLKTLSRNTIQDNQAKRLVRSIMDLSLLDAQVVDAEMRAKQTIMGAYAPLNRRGRYQVRVVALDSDGRVIRLHDNLRAMLMYARMDKRAGAVDSADAVAARLNVILRKIPTSTKMLAEKESGIQEMVSIHKLEARVEEAATQPTLGGTINYDDLAQTLVRAGINLSAPDRARLVQLTSSHHSLARSNLLRAGNPGFDTDMMYSIAQHIETQSHVAGKNKYQHQIADILSTPELWGGDFSKLTRLQNHYREMVKEGNEASIFDARKALDQYQRMYVESANDPEIKIIMSNDEIKTVAGKGKGNRYLDQAGNLVTYYRETRNLVDATGEGVIGSKLQPLIGATAAAQLGGVLAPALINMTSIYTHAIPYLSTYNAKTGFGGGHGMGAATREIHKAMADVNLFRDGFKDRFGTAAELQALREDVEKGKVSLSDYNLTMDELVFIEDLTKKGVLTPNMFNALINTARTGRRGIFGRATDSWMKMFSKTEQYNRRVTALASYRLEKQRMLAQKNYPDAMFADPTSSVSETLYKRATLAVNTSQGNYAQYNRPAWARGNIFQFFYMYKQFVVITVQLMRNLGVKERTMLLGTLLLMTGIKGVPFGDDLMDLIDSLAQMFGIRWDGIEAEAAQLADSIIPGSAPWLTRGLLDNATGLTLSSRFGHGDLIPGTGFFRAGSDLGREMESIFGAVSSFVVALGTTGALITKYLAETVGLREDVTTLADIGREGFGIAALKSLTDGIVYMSDGQITNDRGQVVDKNASTYHSIARMMGFYPASATLQYDVGRMTAQTRDYAAALKASLVDAYIKADGAGRLRILRDVRNINRGTKGTPFYLGNFSSGARKALREANRTVTARGQRALPKATKNLSQSLIDAYGL